MLGQNGHLRNGKWNYRKKLPFNCPLLIFPVIYTLGEFAISLYWYRSSQHRLQVQYNRMKNVPYMQFWNDFALKGKITTLSQKDQLSHQRERTAQPVKSCIKTDDIVRVVQRDEEFMTESLHHKVELLNLNDGGRSDKHISHIVGKCRIQQLWTLTCCVCGNKCCFRFCSFLKSTVSLLNTKLLWWHFSLSVSC